jgi:hypothetical protein
MSGISKEFVCANNTQSTNPLRIINAANVMNANFQGSQFIIFNVADVVDSGHYVVYGSV